MVTDKQLRNFVKFLEAAGAQILEPTNEYEALRFKANANVGVVYQNRHGQITKFFGEAKCAWNAFENKKSYTANKVSERIRRNHALNTLLKRDGTTCFYCGKEMSQGDETIEHLFSINQGGKNHIANLALAHKACNHLANHLPVVKKVELRDKLRGEAANENC
jgi:hypothetical protein